MISTHILVWACGVGLALFVVPAACLKAFDMKIGAAVPLPVFVFFLISFASSIWYQKKLILGFHEMNIINSMSFQNLIF